MFAASLNPADYKGALREKPVYPFAIGLDGMNTMVNISFLLTKCFLVAGIVDEVGRFMRVEV